MSYNFKSKEDYFAAYITAGNDPQSQLAWCTEHDEQDDDDSPCRSCITKAREYLKEKVGEIEAAWSDYATQDDLDEMINFYSEKMDERISDEYWEAVLPYQEAKGAKDASELDDYDLWID